MKILIFLFLSFHVNSAILTSNKNFSKQHQDIKEILNNVLYEQLYERVKDIIEEVKGKCSVYHLNGKDKDHQLQDMKNNQQMMIERKE